MLAAPIVSKLVSSHQISLSGDYSLPIVIATRAQTRIKVKSVAIFEVFWGAYTSNGISSGGTHVCETEYAT